MSKSRKIIMSCFGIIISFVFLFSFASNCLSTYHTYQQYRILEKEKNEIQTETKELSKEVENLKNEEYIIKYARDNYIFLYENEESVILPEKPE